MIEVTHEDREAAKAFWVEYCGGNPLAWERLPEDNQRFTATHFARHRIAAEQRGMIAARDAAIMVVDKAGLDGRANIIGAELKTIARIIKAIATMPMPAGGSDA